MKQYTRVDIKNLTHADSLVSHNWISSRPQNIFELNNKDAFIIIITITIIIIIILLLLTLCSNKIDLFFLHKSQINGLFTSFQNHI